MADEPVHAPEPTIYEDQQWLGRLPAVDERSHLPRFAMAAPPSVRIYRTWLSPKWRDWPAVLDQGSTSQCVAYMACKYLLTHRIVNRPMTTAAQLYKRCQQLDEWPGEDYDGTSVNASMKALREMGQIEKWTWAWEVEPVIRHVLELGPVCMGTDWTMSMFYPDRYGYIWPAGATVGGHAWLLVGANRQRPNPDGTKGAVRLLNSWGPSWGQNGRAWVTLKDLALLLQGLDRWPGEAAAPIEVQVPR